MLSREIPDLVRERASGASYRDIAKGRGMSHETARKLVIAEEKQVIGGIVFDLLSALKAERAGRVGEWPTFLVPNQVQTDRVVALDLVQWVITRLRGLNAPLKVVTRQTPEGTAFMLTLEDLELDR
jgi:hypothetical protein